jgi:hypothetical protein
MNFAITEYGALIDTIHQTMLRIAPLADIRLAPDKWTIKEMVGHLVDSASNNHQRFVRLQQTRRLSFPAYDPERWKEVSGLGGIGYPLLVDLWRSYNLFLLYIIGRIDPASLDAVWEVDGKQKNLEFLVNDYFTHLRWHLDLFEERAAEIAAVERLSRAG